MSRLILLTAFGGFIGTAFRLLISVYIAKKFPHDFPLGTLLVNIAGCFLIGVFWSFAIHQKWLNQDIRFFLLPGLCGGFTTFSAFAIENMLLLQKGNFHLAISYILISIFAGIFVTWLGFSVGKLI